MVVTNSNLKEPNSIDQYYMGKAGGGRFYKTFDYKMKLKEAVLKRLPRAIEAEIKQLMSAQLKTNLAM